MRLESAKSHVEQSRFNMIEQQIRPWDVLDFNVLELFKKVPREDFVPKEYQGLAFADVEIPLGEGQCMLSPKIEGRILQALQIQSHEKILEIGTGSGYLTALLAKSGAKVDSVELFPKLSKQAQKRLDDHRIKNVKLIHGDGVAGLKGRAPYDVIVYTGSLPCYPDEIESQLTVGGRLFVVVGQGDAMEAWLVTRVSESQCHKKVLFETSLPILINAPEPSHFTF
jgi:protein-L-isoaspartate(D-aspartate) O-methyltransferase